MNRRRIREKRRRENIREVFQMLTIFIGGLAFVGWSMAGIWVLYFLMIR